MKLFNTLSREVEELKPLTPGKISIYTCGLTVYSQPHIGNWVGYIYWDVLIRTLEQLGYDVNRIQNITDVGHLVSDDDNGEDKMEKGARAEGITAWEVAQKYIDIANHEGYELLGLKKPKLVRATDCIDQQIAFVQKLEEKGFTYEIPEEGIYFDTSKLNDYGKLARLDITGLDAGARVAFKNKRNVTDFAVWKFSPKGQKRDMEWDSPWGKGFPGWHLECSVIAYDNLGEQIDIHTGGVDHIPIHHTNEIAQTESVTGKQFAQMWIHNNHLKVDGGKMSKSLGNIYTLQDLLDRGYSLEAFKLLVLSKNYHTEGNFTWEIMDAAQNRLKSFLQLSSMVWQSNPDAALLGDTYFAGKQQAILDALADNLSSSRAIAVISEVTSDVERFGLHPKHVNELTGFLSFAEDCMGLHIAEVDITSAQKKALQKRATARADKDWKASDEIRDDLKTQGIGINDSNNSQIWYRF